MTDKKEGLTKKAAKGTGKLAADVTKGAVVGAGTAIVTDAVISAVKEKKVHEKAIKKASESKKKLDDSGILDKAKGGVGKKLGKIKKKK